MSFVGSYVWKMRQMLGRQRLLVSGVGLIVTAEDGKVWLGLRSDSRDWSYFGGAMELGDSVMDTVRNEMREETGIDTNEADWTFVGIHSDPLETNYTYPNGDAVQIVNHLFTMRLKGEPGLGDEEHTEFALFDLNALPTPMKADTDKAIALYKAFLETGKVQVK